MVINEMEWIYFDEILDEIKHLSDLGLTCDLADSNSDVRDRRPVGVNLTKYELK